jgi:hypothetical protein
MAARNGNGMRGSVGCYSIVHCWNIYIYIYIYIYRNDGTNVLVPKRVYTFSKTRFLVLQGFMKNENKI